jgi:ketosteroid isomerase-like protein
MSDIAPTVAEGCPPLKVAVPSAGTRDTARDFRLSDTRRVGPEENKAVVRRFLEGLIARGELGIADELLAPDYVNLIVEGIDPRAAVPSDDTGSDVEALKAAIAEQHASATDFRCEVVDMAAEGDAVFARLRFSATLNDGRRLRSRGLGYYRIVDGKIAMNDVLSVSE